MFQPGRRSIAILTVLALVFTALPALAATAMSDIGGHWAEGAIRQLADKGVVAGLPDGSFKAEFTVKRAEFVTMVNKSLGIAPVAGVSRFHDVQADAWFAGQVEAAAVRGYVAGNPDGSFSPYRPITREQAAAMLVRAFGLAPLAAAERKAALAPFVDADQVSAWAKADLAIAVSQGLISGYTPTTLAPKPANLSAGGWQAWEASRTTEQREAALNKLGSAGLITRGQTAAVLVRALGQKPAVTANVLDKAGTYGPEDGMETITGDVTITSDGVALRNLVITGNLTIAESVGDGTVTLENVTVKGKTEVKGGGTHSVIFRDCTLQGTVTVEKVDGQIRIVAEGSTSVPKIVLQSGAILISTGDGSFEQVLLPKDLDTNTQVILTGNFAEVEIAAQKANVQVGADSQIDSLVLTKNATGSQVDLGKKASVNTVTANAKAEIIGQGTIGTAEINVDGVTIEQKPAKTVLEPGVKANVGGKDVSEPKKSSGGGGGSPEVAVAEVTLDKGTMMLTVGGAKGTLIATVRPANATNKKVTWSSSNQAVATVAGGVVTPKAAGIATITATSAADATKKATCTVTVKLAKEPVEVNKTALTDAISAANANKTTATVSTDGKDVDPANKWVTQEVMTAYETAIAAAQSAADKADATQKEVDDAVTALTTATTIFNDAKQVGTKVVTPVAVTGITVKTAPTKVTYTEGETLDLSGLVVTLTKSDESTEEVALADFAAKGITTTPANEAVLAITDTEVVITVNGKTASQAITVNVAPVATKSLKTFTPVLLTQTGDIANNNVQYQTAEAVIAALPTTIEVTLEDGTTKVNVPVTWADTDTYNAGVAADYTFTATWGVMPQGADNDDNLAAPTLEVTAAQGVLEIKVTVKTTKSPDYFQVILSSAITISKEDLSLKLGDTPVTIKQIDGVDGNYWIHPEEALQRGESYTLSITKVGYNFGEPVSVVIPKVGIVTGTVTNQNDEPLEDVKVNVGLPIVGETTTGADGKYTINDVIEGTHDVSFDKTGSGYKYKRISDVQVVGTVTVDAKLDLDDTAKVAIAKANLDLGDVTAVTADLALPATQDDATVTWVSSNTDVISNDGKVTRPAAGKLDATVTLTATIDVGVARDTKAFTVTVTAMETPATYTITIAEVIGGAANISSDKSGAAEENEEVTVWIAGIEAGMQFKSITVTDTDSGNVATTEITAGGQYTFIMPAKAVAIRVELEAIPEAPAAPQIKSAVCEEGILQIGDEEETGLGEGDTLTITFNVPINKTLKELRKLDVDSIIDWGDKSFGNSYKGWWYDNSRLVITCLDATGATFVAGDPITIKTDADVRTADGLSEPSTATALTTGDFEPFSNSITIVNPKTLIESDDNDGSFGVSNWIDIQFDKLIAVDLTKADVAANNLPAGLDFGIAYVSGNKRTISITGNATNHAASDSVNIAITFPAAKVNPGGGDLTTESISITFKD